MIDHKDVAVRAFALSALPDPPRAAAQVLPYITRLLSMLPPEEKPGYVKGPQGGENVAPLPDGTLVRVSRVMYPDGDIYKVMNDAPNGGPQWIWEDHRPELYVPYVGGSVPSPPPAPDPIETRLHLVETRAALLWDVYVELAKQIGILNQQLADLDAVVVRQPLPEYVGKFWGFTVTSRPKG